MSLWNFVTRVVFPGVSFVVAVLAQGCVACRPIAAQAAETARLDREAIVRELRDDTLAGVNRRLGPDYAACHPQAATESFPKVWMPPVQKGGREYQIGGPWTQEAGDFSSTQGQIFYAPDAGFFPVDRVTIIEWSNGGFTEAPMAPWHGGFRPEPAAKKWQEAAPQGGVGMPVAMARGMGGWANNGLAVFSSGLVAAGGTVTARGLEPTFCFPPEKVPTAISITNKSEFALVTLYDTQRKTGQVAVFSLQVDGRKMSFVHEWHDDHAWSLPNVAMFTDIKLLGYVDLPGVEFPTGICAVGNREGGRMNGRDGNAGVLREYDLAVQADRDVFLKGSNCDFSSTAGFAVVIAKYEGKAVFLDLEPLFQRIRTAYFTTEENYRQTRDSGPGARQWPFTFDVYPAWKPKIVKTIDVLEPTAVIATLSGGEKARALIASRDGKLGVYRVGGLATEGPADPADIERVAEVQLGRNPVCLAYQKGVSDTIMAVVRGDREVVWIKYSSDAPKVIRRLRDQRMIDPVFVESSDTHGIETPLMTVADFKGRKIINYRFGELIFATQGGARFGMGPNGKDEFECGGVLELPGSPFVISATNVN